VPLVYSSWVLDLSSTPDTIVNDKELLARSAAGDGESFRLFVARYRAAIFRYLCVLTPSAADAEDLMQETFLAAWRGAATFRSEASPKTWLYTIARNAAFHYHEKLARLPLAETPLEELGRAAGWGGPTPEQIAVLSEQATAVAEAMARLAPVDRAILLLRDVEGLDGESAAKLLQLTVPAMKTRLHRARLRLMGALAKEVLR
jgi:RNA polymerase sigma-70 factor (ECF subfamily)